MGEQSRNHLSSGLVGGCVVGVEELDVGER